MRLLEMMIGVIGRGATRLLVARRLGDGGVPAMIVGVLVVVPRLGEVVVGGEGARAIRTRAREAIAGIAAAAAVATEVDVDVDKMEDGFVVCNKVLRANRTSLRISINASNEMSMGGRSADGDICRPFVQGKACFLSCRMAGSMERQISPCELPEDQ